MDEAAKTNRARGPDFAARYFSGRVLDIGCGDDPVVPHAVPFDRPQGDANNILDYLPRESFDCVHSSHALEHMRDVPKAFRDWWALVKPGGFMITVVPDEDLYEQGNWPSLFNSDHKATFRLEKATSWSPVSYDLRRLAEALPDCTVVDARIQDDFYDRSLPNRRPTALGHALMKLAVLRYRILWRLGVRNSTVLTMFDRIENRMGRPIDQTLGRAMAQIQVILRKNRS